MDLITEMYRISGDGCYIMVLHTSSHQQLEETLAHVLHYGDYRINTVIKTYEKRKNKILILSFFIWNGNFLFAFIYKTVC